MTGHRGERLTLLERSVLVAILDDGISPGFIWERVGNPEFIAALDPSDYSQTSVDDVASAVERLRSLGHVWLQDSDRKRIGSLDDVTWDEDTLWFGVWCELTERGQQLAESLISPLST